MYSPPYSALQTFFVSPKTFYFCGLQVFKIALHLIFCLLKNFIFVGYEFLQLSSRYENRNFCRLFPKSQLKEAGIIEKSSVHSNLSKRIKKMYNYTKVRNIIIVLFYINNYITYTYKGLTPDIVSHWSRPDDWEQKIRMSEKGEHLLLVSSVCVCVCLVQLQLATKASFTLANEKLRMCVNR